MYIPCRVHPAKDHIICKPIIDIKDNSNRNTVTDTDDIIEIFLKFQFTGASELGAFKPSINGILHRPHAVPPQVIHFLFSTSFTSVLNFVLCMEDFGIGN